MSKITETCPVTNSKLRKILGFGTTYRNFL